MAPALLVLRGMPRNDRDHAREPDDHDLAKAGPGGHEDIDVVRRDDEDIEEIDDDDIVEVTDIDVEDKR